MSKPTPEEIERIRAERAAKKAAKSAQPVQARQPSIYPREWIKVDDAPGRRVRVVTWNMLAQGLVRRSLFPGSDCLRSRDRIPGIAAELSAYDWDIGCFQEVDCENEQAKALRAAGYEFTCNKGFDTKQHGLMIAWRARRTSEEQLCFCSPVCTRVQYLDDLRLNEHTNGLSRVTRNVALFAALPYVGGGGGVIVATTHLFWKPRYAYERARQVAVMLHELSRFRASEPSWASWPTIVAGDFNDQPDSPTYTLATGLGRAYKDTLERELLESRVIDASVAPLSSGMTVEDGDPDRILDPHSAPAEGALYTTDELINACGDGLRSAYGSAYAKVPGTDLYFCVRRD